MIFMKQQDKSLLSCSNRCHRHGGICSSLGGCNFQVKFCTAGVFLPGHRAATEELRLSCWLGCRLSIRGWQAISSCALAVKEKSSFLSAGSSRLLLLIMHGPRCCGINKAFSVQWLDSSLQSYLRIFHS